MQDHGRLTAVHISKHSLFRLKITVGCPPCTCPSIRVCDIEESNDGDDGQRRGANKKRSDSVCQIGRIRDSNASRRYAGRSFTRKTLRRSRIFLPLDSGQKPRLIKEGRRIKCNPANYVPIVVPGLSTQALQAQQHLHLRQLYRRKP